MSTKTEQTRKLRDRPRLDYKAMSHGGETVKRLEPQAEGGSDSDGQTQGATGGILQTEGDVGVRHKYGLDIDADDGIYHADELGEDREPLKDPDAELYRLKQQLADLQDEEASIRKKAELQSMRRQIQEQKERVETLRGTLSNDSKLSKKLKKSEKTERKKKPVSSIEKTSKHETVLNDDVTLDTLRKNKSLKSKVSSELRKLQLLSDSDEETDSSDSRSSSDSYFDDSSDDQSKKKKKNKSKKKKSGINAKASDRVKHPQKWPQSHLQFEYVNKQVKFDELDFKLFVAGELEIISDDELSPAERSGRLTLLKKIVYYYSTYEFKGLKAFYAAWVREIELGKKKWSDDSSQIESAILSKFVLKSSKSPFSVTRKSDNLDNEDRAWFCQAYQRNKCLHKASHTETFRGKLKLAQHICATCYLKDKKKLAHPECSSSCPHTAP